MPIRSQGTDQLDASNAATRPEEVLFSDETEVGALCRGVDWGATPLGDPARWPLSLRTTVRIMLSSRFAMWMAWGPELTMLYNDAYARMTLGAKHPWALGKPASTVWAEIWSDIGPRIATVMETGVATWDEALLLFLERSGYPEETYHTFSYSPLSGDDGSIMGMLCVVSEETNRVIGDRRLGSLRDLAAGLSSVVDEDDVLRATAAALRANSLDLPFAAVYLLDAEGNAVLGCTSGVEPGAAAAPARFSAGSAERWPLSAMLDDGAMVVVDDLPALIRSASGGDGRLPTGAWQTPPTRGVMLPIAQPGGDRPDGFLVAGLNPFRPLDAEYNGFLLLVAGQVGASLANARAREAERRRAEELAELDRAKTQFFSNVSHEFRTPLTLLLGPAEDALNDATTSVANRERMEIIHRNALRMLRLVNNLLDFSRIEAGRVTARHEATDLGAYTAELASSFRSAMERAGLRLTVEATPGVEAYVDREMWEKVVLNLLSNAFKHTFAGGVAIRVFARGGQAVMELSDTGVGIPAEQLPHIFERFHRVPNARSRTHEGTGIGLALVQELVRLHHGTISVASVPDAGTTFTVAIPQGTAHLRPGQLPTDATAAQPPRLAGTTSVAFVEEASRWLTGSTSDGVSAAAAADEAGPSVRAFGPLEGARVLVADDNADMREYVTRLLRDRGCVVTPVADGGAALAAARSEDPELIVSDVMMPGLDGFELIRALRARSDTRRIPVILLSARAGEEARVEGIAAGADDYLVKPFSARELVARVEGRIQLDRTRRETEREREQLLARVESERARLQTVFAQAPAGIAVLEGPRHVYASANAHYLQLIGNRPIVGRAIRDALPELAGQGLYELLDEVYRTAIPFVGSERQVMIAMGDGQLREYFFTFVYQPIVDAAGASTGIFIHVVDVTSQVRARQEVEAAKDAAERANRAKSEFLAAMSHELRTPLNAIGGYTQLIELGVHGPVTEEQRTALSRVQRSQQHLLSLINDVLNFAKLEAGRVEYDIEDVDLTTIAATVGPMIEPQLTERRLTYEVQVEAGLTVRADVERLQQIVLNLLSNAVKFTHPGGTITLEARRSPRGPAFVEMRVRDTGIGIAADKLESIFDPFVQAHRNLTRTTEGTGLGLAISRDLAIAMQGELSVESEEGRGSTFTIVLPAA